MKRCLSIFIILTILSAGACLAVDSTIRLAVLAEDVSSESRALADLLTAELSKTIGVQVVERSEIDRVLAEQKLTAGGLIETASRVQLGRLLKANGLVLIQKDVARQTRILVRMVETKNGFLAGYYQYPFENISMEKITRDVSADIQTSLPKLRSDPSKMQRVAISRIGNATLRLDYNWLESDLPVLLAMTFSAEPGILLMERRQLGEALNEAHLTGDKGELKTGNVLIDGEVALIYGPIPKGGSMPIVMTLRFRDATLKEIGRVSREGRLSNLDKMTTETMALALAKLREIGQRPAEKASAEPEMLLKMAKRHGYVWAADAAYALSPTNIAAKNQLITQLLDESVPFLPMHDPTLQDYLYRAKKLARADQLCREEKNSLLSYMIEYRHNVFAFFTQPETILDADIRAALKPVRATYRREIESQQAGEKLDSIKLMGNALAFFDNPLDYFFYTRGVYETMTRSAKTEKERREAAICAISQCMWPPEMYLDMAESPDPVIRYFALTKLMRFQGNRAKQKQYADQAAGYFDDVLKIIPLLINNSGLDIFGAISLFNTTVQDMIDASPDQQPSINDKLYAKFNELLDHKYYCPVSLLRPQDCIPRLPLSNAVPLADRIIAEYYAMRGPRIHDTDQYGIMIASIEKWRQKISEKYSIPVGTNEPVKTLVLLSSESPEWRQSAGQLAPDPSASKRNRMVIIPQQFLIDGDILWVGLGGLVPNEPYLHATGLMKLDLTTGRVVACRYGKVKGEAHPMGEVLADHYIDRDAVYFKSVLPVFKWHDYIVVGHGAVGVFFYPILTDSSVTDISGVTILNMDAGLPSNQLLSIAALNDWLFIMTRPGTVRYKKDGKWITQTGGEGWILSEWHRKTRTVKILADSEKQIGGLEWVDNIFRSPQMTTDPTNGCLNFKFTLVRKNPDGIMVHAGQALYTYNPSTEKWCLAATNAITAAKPAPESSPRIVPKDYYETYDVQNYKGGTLAITGYGQHWKLVFFHRAGDETAARWARAQPLTSAGVPTVTDSATLIEAARAGDIPRLQQLIAQGNNINIQNEDGLTPLSRSIGGKQSETALWLIRHGADINLASHDGGTPLVWAAWRDLTNVVLELLARNADPNAGFNNGQTALMLAASNGNLDLVKRLIEKGARTASMDKDGQNVFIWAAYAPKSDVLEYFLQSEPDKPTLNKALFAAANNNQTNNIALLLKHGADINLKNKFGTPLLIKAAMYSEPETLQFLIDHGAKVNDPSSKGSSALMMAAEKNRADNMRVLLRAGADLMYVAGYRTVFNLPLTTAEVRAVLLEALGQYILRTGDDRP